MYDAFYGFREKPFSLLPDPAYLYLSPQHEKAMGLLELSLHNQAGFCVISGEIGAGKTTLIRKLLTLMGGDYCVGLVSNTLNSFGELMDWILMAYGLRGGGSPVEQHERFIDFVIQQYGRGRRTVLIVDEAQNLTVDALEELRMLSNVNADKHQVLQVILVGQAGLRDTLKRPELAQFAQRILMDFHLAPLGRDDTLQYIRHRILVAGADPQLFTPEAAASVYRYSGGIPRVINLLCDTALVYGYAEGNAVIGEEIVHAVVRERQSSGAPPALRLAAMAPPLEAVEHIRALSVVRETSLPVEAASPVGDIAQAAPAPTATPSAVSQPEEPAPAVNEGGVDRVAIVTSGEAARVTEGTAAPAEPEILTSAPAEPVSVPDAEPAETAGSSDLAVPVPEGDAEWLRRLADSAVPTALREPQRTHVPVAAEPQAISAVAEHAPPPVTPAMEATTTAKPGLWRVAGLVVVLLAGGGVVYWYPGSQPVEAIVAPAVVPSGVEKIVPALPDTGEQKPEPDKWEGIVQRRPVVTVAEPAPAPAPASTEAPVTAPLPAALPVLEQEDPEQGEVMEETPAISKPAGVDTGLAPASLVKTSPDPVSAPLREVAKPALAPTPQPVAPAEADEVPLVVWPEPITLTPDGPVPQEAVAPSPGVVPEPDVSPAPATTVPQEGVRGSEGIAQESLAATLSPARETTLIVEASTAPDAGVREAAADAAAEETESVPAEEPRFTADPCKGPAARYLSTCR